MYLPQEKPFPSENSTLKALIGTNPKIQIEPELCQGVLNLLDTGIGFMGKDYSLLSYNASFAALLESNQQALLGKKLYANIRMGTKSLREIHHQLVKDENWEGVLPSVGKGLKVTITRSNFPVLASHLKDIYYTVMISDHSEFIKLQHEFTEAKSLAKKLDRTKSNFLSQMTHELRTPLNAVLGFSQLLKIEPNLSEEQKDNLSEIISASDHLLELINEILDLSKIEHGDLKLTNGIINVDDLIAECVSLLKPLAQKSNIQIIQHQSCIQFVNDRVRLKQVLLNLLSNAIKYNAKDGRVVIQSFLVDDNNMRIEVQDSGKGIPAALLSTIFNPFERLGFKNSQIEGTGIGLMITRRLVNSMQGLITVLSEPACGSIFSLHFPTNSTNSSTTLRNDNAYLLPGIRKILWIGKDPDTQKFAERLSALRPSLEFHHAKDIPSAIRFNSNIKPDLIFLFVKESLSQLNKPSPETKKLLKGTPTVAVVGTRSCSEDKLDFKLEFTDYLSMRLNTIDFMEIIDNQLCR